MATFVPATVKLAVPVALPNPICNVPPVTAPVAVKLPVGAVRDNMLAFPALADATVIKPVELSVTVVFPVEFTLRVWLTPPVPTAPVMAMPPVPAVAVNVGEVTVPADIELEPPLPSSVTDVLPVRAPVALMLPLLAVKDIVVPPSAFARLKALLPAAAVPVKVIVPSPVLPTELVITPAEPVRFVPAARVPSESAVLPFVRLTVFVAAVLVSDRADTTLVALFRLAVAPPPLSARVKPVVAVNAPAFV